MRRLAALVVMSIFGLMLVVTTGGPAFAVPQLTVDGPGAPVPYGSTLVPISGPHKDANSFVLINSGMPCDSSPAFRAIDGPWSCDASQAPIFQAVSFNVSEFDFGTNTEGPTTQVDVQVAASKFTVSTPTSVGTTVTVTGIRDAASTDVTAVLNPGAIETGEPSSGCDLDTATTYVCTFTGIANASGYSVDVTQHLEDSHNDDIATAPFSVGPVAPPNPPGNPKPPSNPKPANPTIAPLLQSPLVPTPTTTPTPTPTPSTAPTSPSASAPVANSPTKHKHHQVSDATKRLLEMGIAGMVIFGLGRGRGLSRSEVVFAWRDDGEVKRKVDLVEKIGPGDRSITWRFPWHAPLDATSLVLPGKLAPRSPFLGRLAADGGEFRAMFGTLWLLFPAAGAVLGALAFVDTSGDAVPPAYWLVAGITVLAIFEALAGAVATVVFFGGILLTGGFWNEAEPDFPHSVLVFLILSLLWTSLPLIGTATRPFRRLGKPSARYAWDRVADLIIASLLCAWIAQKSIEVTDLFAGTETGLEHHADQLAIIVLATIVIRIVIEHLASIWYPKRLTEVETDGELPPPTRTANLVGITVRTAAYSFIGHVFIGTCWQWWLGTALFFVPQVGALVQHRFRAVELFKKLVPKGLVEVFVLIVACTLAVRFAEEHVESDLDAIKYAFLALAVPPALIGAVSLFGGEAERGKRTWVREMLGLVILVITVTLALQGWEY